MDASAGAALMVCTPAALNTNVVARPIATRGFGLVKEDGRMFGSRGV